MIKHFSWHLKAVWVFEKKKYIIFTGNFNIDKLKESNNLK